MYCNVRDILLLKRDYHAGAFVVEGIAVEGALAGAADVFSALFKKPNPERYRDENASMQNQR